MDFDSEEKWKIQEREVRRLVVSKEKEESIIDFFYEFTKLRANMESEYTVFGTNISGSLILKESFVDTNAARLERYPAIPIELCKKKLVYGQEIELKKGSYLCCYGRGLFQVGNPILQRIRSYMNLHGLQIAGNIYERDILDMSLTNDEEELAHCIEIPVIS